MNTFLHKKVRQYFKHFHINFLFFITIKKNDQNIYDNKKLCQKKSILNGYILLKS